MAKSTTPEKGAEVSAQPEEGSRSKVSRVRRYAPGIVFALLVIGLVTGIGSGTLCSVGYESIAAVCPLGALESLFGAGAFVARAVIILAVAAAVVLLVGKAFCSWVCPIPPLDRFLSGKKRREADKAARIEAAHHVSGRLAACAGCAGCGEKKPGETPLAPADGTDKRRFAKVDGRHVVLGGSLVSAAICGFPVFCLICPVGLTFATAIALYRLVGFNEPTLGPHRVPPHHRSRAHPAAEMVPPLLPHQRPYGARGQLQQGHASQDRPRPLPAQGRHALHRMRRCLPRVHRSGGRSGRPGPG